jgi:hypothetical protein
MREFKPENLVGDTNMLLYAILTELRQFNESVQSLRSIAKNTVTKPKIVKPKPKAPKKDKPKKEVVKNGLR